VITDEQRHQLEVADRTRDLDVIGIIVDDMLVETLVAPLEIETALRDAAAQTYLIANQGEISIVLGMQNWLAALEQHGITPEENRAALAALAKE